MFKNKSDRTARDKEVLREHNKIKNEKVVNSHEIGETGAASAMNKQHPDFELEHGGPATTSSSGDFDQIYYNKHTDEYIVIEAKGGNADVGSAKTADGRAEQGTLQHSEYTIERMKQSGDTAKRKIAGDLEDAMEMGNVKFYKAQTKIKNGKAQETILTEFKLD